MGEYKHFKRTRRQKRPETISVGEGISKMFDVYKIRGRYDQEVIKQSWEKIMSKMIAQRTIKIYLKDATLFVQFDSAPLKQELLGARPRMVELINEELGRAVVKEIVIM